MIVASTPPGAGFTAPPRRHKRQDEYVDMTPRPNEYLEMRPADLPRSPPTAPTAPAAPVATTPDGYVEMSYAPKRTLSIASSSKHEPPTPLGSQTIFPLTLESPLSPPRQDCELQPTDVFDDDYGPHPLATVREISEENHRRSPEVGSPPHYVRLARPLSQPIAAPHKSTTEDEFPCNPTATKTWAGDPKVGSARFAEERKSSSPAPTENPTLNYAALDLEPRAPNPTQPARAYTQIDFARSEKMHTADAN